MFHFLIFIIALACLPTAICVGLPILLIIILAGIALVLLVVFWQQISVLVCIALLFGFIRWLFNEKHIKIFLRRKILYTTILLLIITGCFYLNNLIRSTASQPAVEEPISDAYLAELKARQRQLQSTRIQSNATNTINSSENNQTNNSFTNNTSSQNNLTASKNKVTPTTYGAELQSKIKSYWKPPRMRESNDILVRFTIDTNGYIQDLQILTPCKNSDANLAAVDAIKTAAPFGPLPSGSPSTIEFTFYYNEHDS